MFVAGRRKLGFVWEAVVLSAWKEWSSLANTSNTVVGDVRERMRMEYK